MDEETNETSAGGMNIATTGISENLSVLRPYGYSTARCGYCKGLRSDSSREQEPGISPSNLGSLPSMQPSTNSSASKSSLASKSYSVLADSVSPSLYEGLINRGWRRSGSHLYKPQNFSSCCPTLTTRLLTQQFKPSKSQRKVLKKMENIFRLRHLPCQRKEQLAAKGTMTSTSIQMSTLTSTSKKQKRNHSGKNKGNDRNSTTISSKYDNYCSHSESAKSKSILRIPSLEEQCLETGILQRLEEATINALEKFLPPSSVHYIQNSFGREPTHNHKWKTSYKILPPSKRQRKRSQVKAITSICAQISGKLSYKLPNDQIPRDILVQQVVQAIRNSEDSLYPPNLDINNNLHTSSNNCTASVTSVEAHLPSGQIACTIQIEENIAKIDTTAYTRNNENETDTEMNVSPNENHKSNNESNSNIYHGKLAKWYEKNKKWYEKNTGKRFDLEPDKDCITIETLTAHQSALDPDVHRLYSHYQHVVHNDPDPFSDDPSNNILERNNGNDDEDEEPKLETDDPSELDWGNAPTYFKCKISAMLTTYIQSIDSQERRRAVLSNFFSFYQFLVESPFPIPYNNNKHNKIPTNNDHNTQQRPGPSLPCGLYHQHYRLGDLLVAVGVIDILPTGLSSVYLFYNPSFSYELVALGKYAILKEIEFARDILKVPYYYLGYYIESCQKMRYKADYKPTQMLCPKYYNWVDATTAISKLRSTPRHVCALSQPLPHYDAKKHNRLKESVNVNDEITDALNALQMDIGAGLNVTIDMLHSSGVEVVKPILKEFISEFSPALSRKCILKLN